MFHDFYGLTGKPFQLTPDPDFYFRSITHRKALSYLGYGLAQGEGFIVITGEIGAGKSTLVAHLMETVDPAQLTVAQIVTSKLDAEEIIHVIAQSFGLDITGHDKASALGAIEAFLHDEARAGRRCLLIVDESQNLPVEALEELRMLSNFQLGSHPLLQTLLLGQPEFRTTLQSHHGLEQLRQRVIAAHHLSPMEEGEVEAYLTHRLNKVGWDGNPEFAPEIFVQLHAASGGIPRKLNQIANRLMLLGAVEQCAHIDGAMLDAVLAEMQGEKPVIATTTLAEPPEPTEDSDGSSLVGTGVAAAGIAAAGSAAIDLGGSGLDRAEVAEMLATRDAKIAELQQAVVEISNRDDDDIAESVKPEIAVLQEEVSRLEARLFEQERMVRHTLTMMIEWMESDVDQDQAA